VEIARTGKAALTRNRLLEPEREEFLSAEEKAFQPQTKTVFIKVNVDRQNRSEIIRVVDIFRGRIVDSSGDFYTIKVTGHEGVISGILELLKDFGVSHIGRPRKLDMEEPPRLQFQWGELVHPISKAPKTRSKKH
jgi:acetolactate synthase small subunit